MNDENKSICIFCRQPLPDEKNIIHTHYGKTCSWICSNALSNEKTLENEIEKLSIKINNITQYLNDKIRKETGCCNVKIDFDK